MRLDAVVPGNGDASGMWDFPPAFTCSFREHLGRLSDGVKVVCNWQALVARWTSRRATGATSRPSTAFWLPPPILTTSCS